MNKTNIFWQNYLGIEKELLEVSRYIYITDTKEEYVSGNIICSPCNSQLEMFSPHLADLLVRTCIEIEAISKELYFEYGGLKKRGDKGLYFDEDCLKLIDQKCKTHNKVVTITCQSFNLSNNDNLFFKPLKEAHKRGGTDWERAYQAIKHDRLTSISKATIKVLIHAIGALYLLNVYFRDVRLLSKYFEVDKLDFSLGSSIFSVKRPNDLYVKKIINDEIITDVMESTDSPFILKYTDSTCKKVIESNKDLISKIEKYIQSSPEYKEEDFQKQLSESLKKEDIVAGHRCIPLWELSKYRINKKVPVSLSFDERKKIFVSTSEWNLPIRLHNKHLNENELNEVNIQDEIDHAGILAGMMLQQQFENEKMVYAFSEGFCELVLDNGSVKYNI